MADPCPEDDVRLSVVSPREYRVAVFLTAEEFVALEHMCERTGLRQSPFIRMLLRERMERVADAALADANRPSTAETQVRHR